jgi:hypothetical protein
MLLERYAELLRLVEGMQRDFERFALKQNRRAGIRLRKQLQELRRLAKEIRQEIQQVRHTFPPRPKRRRDRAEHSSSSGSGA